MRAIEIEIVKENDSVLTETFEVGSGETVLGGELEGAGEYTVRATSGDGSLFRTVEMSSEFLDEIQNQDTPAWEFRIQPDDVELFVMDTPD
ncbi:MAG: hypothetical protein ACI8UR_001364 [Natronomonas sp.]|jgi:hypothetical protein|uniref:hypothetical protein n=1 Tax=Natronomonas sp. TaxID=2184060 RepID=UPI0039E64526